MGRTKTLKKSGALRRERIEMRLTPEQKVLVQRAAAIEGRSVSDFLITSATHRAEEVVRAQQVLRLTLEDSLIFAHAVLDPAEPNEALRAAAGRHTELIG